MGFESWIYCDAGKIRKSRGQLYPTRAQRLVAMSKDHPACILIPEEFGGKNKQKTAWYDGYANVGSTDVYVQTADWNRKWASENPAFVLPFKGKRLEEHSWYPFYADLTLSHKEVEEKWAEATGAKRKYYRDIGIDLACEDENNAVIRYPIKIAKSADSIYENCPPSPADPYQGCD